MTNHYDQPIFFEAYGQMDRSKHGLEGAGEWHELKKMLPDFKGQRVLDLGCGYGWHCRYAVEQGAEYVLGIDLSAKMLAKAVALTTSEKIVYRQLDLQDIGQIMEPFDLVISSLAFHYMSDFKGIVQEVSRLIGATGHFVFSVEHPIFTAQGQQEWCYDQEGQIKHWPVDHYYQEGPRLSHFLGEEILKYHRTLTTYLTELVTAGFVIRQIVEPQPSLRMLENDPGMKDELRRPMMLLVGAEKK